MAVAAVALVWLLPWTAPLQAQAGHLGFQVEEVRAHWRPGRLSTTPDEQRSHLALFQRLHAALLLDEGPRPAADSGAVQAHMLLGELYQDIRRPVLAIRNYARALDLVEAYAAMSRADSLLAAELLLRLAEQQAALVNRDAAAALAAQSLRLHALVAQAPLPLRLTACHRAADLLSGLRLLRPAEAALRDALACLRGDGAPSPAPDLQAGTLWRLADHFLARDLPDSAWAFIAMAEPLKDLCTPRSREALATVQARCHAARHEWQLAQEQMDAAFLIARQDSLHRYRRLAALHEARGRILASQGRHAEALAAYQRAFNDWYPAFKDTLVHHNPQIRFWDGSPIVYRLLSAKAASFLAIGQAHRALLCHDAAFDFVDHLRRWSLLDHAPQFEANALQQDYEAAIALAYEEYKANNDDPIYLNMLFKFMERRRTNELLQSQWELNHFGESWTDSLMIALPARQFGVTRQVAWGLSSMTANAAYQSLRDTIATRMPGFAALSRPVTVATPLSVAAGLGDKEAFLELFIGARHAYVFGTDRQGGTCVRVSLPKGYHTAVDSVAAMLRRTPNPASKELDYVHYQKWSLLLYNTWLGPLVHGVGQPRPMKLITVAPDARQPFIPFEALVAFKGGSTHFLTAAYLKRWVNFRYCHSATLDEGDNHHAPELQTMLAVSPMAGERDLLGTARVAYDAFNKSRLLRESRANESSVVESARNYRLLHLACPCMADPQLPLRSFFTLQKRSGDADSLHGHELMSLGLRAELAMVAACEDAKGRGMTVGGWMEMARAFKVAGCARLMANLWNVGDGQSEDMIDFFYERLRAGHPATRALHEAQLRHLASEEVQEEPLLAHPYFWAGLVAIGTEGPRMGQGPTNWTPWLVWGSIFALAIALYQRRRRNRRRLFKRLRAQGKA